MIIWLKVFTKLFFVSYKLLFGVLAKSVKFLHFNEKELMALLGNIFFVIYFY